MDHGLPPALELLARAKDPVADQALLAAAPHLEGEVLAAVVNLLIKREHTPSLVQLLRQRRSAAVRFDPLLIAKVNELHPALNEALVSSDLDDRLGAVALIAAAKDARCADLLVDGLRHTCSKTRQAAADALVALTEHVLSQPCSSPYQVSVWQAHVDRLAAALQSALEAWRQHHQPGVLQSALRLMPEMQDFIARAAEQTGTPLAHALEKAIEDAADPALGEAVVRCLAIPALRTPAARAVSRTSHANFITGILKSAWLIVDPAVRHGCLSIRKNKWEADWLRALGTLEASQIDTALAFIAGTGGSAEAKIELVRHLLSSSSAAARRGALWQAVRHADEAPALRLLESLAVRNDDELATIAKLECARRSSSWSDTDSTKDQTTASGAETVAALRHALLDPNPTERVRALAAIERSNAPASFKDDCLRLLRDPSPAVRSAAVSLLPKLPVTNPAYLLRQSLHDEDVRVQANAVEIADCLHLTDLLPIVAGRMSVQDARLRANAVKFCAQEGVHEAGEALIAMLESPLSAHRRSALWVAEKLNLSSLRARVERLAATDADAAVKKLALRLVQRFSNPVYYRGPRPAATT